MPPRSHQNLVTTFIKGIRGDHWEAECSTLCLHFLPLSSLWRSKWPHPLDDWLLVNLLRALRSFWIISAVGSALNMLISLLCSEEQRKSHTCSCEVLTYRLDFRMSSTPSTLSSLCVSWHGRVRSAGLPFQYSRTGTRRERCQQKTLPHWRVHTPPSRSAI